MATFLLIHVARNSMHFLPVLEKLLAEIETRQLQASYSLDTYGSRGRIKNAFPLKLNLSTNCCAYVSQPSVPTWAQTYSTITNIYCLFGMKIRERDQGTCNFFPVRNIWTSLYLWRALLLVYPYVKFRHTTMRRGKRLRFLDYGVHIFGSDGSNLSAAITELRSIVP